MRKNLGSFPISTMLLVSALALVSCEKLKLAAAKLKNKEKSGASEVATQATYSGAQIADLKKADYAGFIARKDALVVVDFHAEWCGPCKMLGPILVKATEAHPGLVYLGRVDVDQAPDLAAEQKVSSIPDVRIFKNGVEVDRFVGFPGEAQVLDKLATLSAGITPSTAPAVAATQAAADPAVKPFSKGWLPPGVSRKSSITPPNSKP